MIATTALFLFASIFLGPAFAADDPTSCYMRRNSCETACDSPSLGLEKDWDAIHACRDECSARYDACMESVTPAAPTESASPAAAPAQAPVTRVNPPSQESAQVLVQSGAELVTATIALGEMMRTTRLEGYPPHARRGKAGGFISRALTCDAGANRPGLGLGWCRDGDYHGLMQVGVAGFVSQSDGDFAGLLQVGALWNLVGQDFKGGLQLSPIGNQVRLDFLGVAQVGLWNGVSGDFIGLAQLGLLNSAGTMRGLAQIGMIDTAGLGPLFQVGLYCDAGQMLGLQVGGFLNRGSLAGLAVSPLFNVHEEIKGLQVGFLNHASTVRGVQIGFLNMTRALHGVQVGLLNISNTGGLPFMVLLNIGAVR